MTFFQYSSGILGDLPRGVAVIILKDRFMGYAPLFQIMLHDDWFVITFLSMAAANQNEFAVALPIEVNSMIQACL